MANPTIKQITLPSGTTYDIMDEVARSQSGGAIIIRGETTTALTDNATTNPIQIGGNAYTAIANDAVFYSRKEFVFDGSHWHEFGDMSGLGDLAQKDSASGSFTPAGTVAAPTISVATAGATASVTPFGSAGSLPTLSMTVSDGNLTVAFSQGTLPTAGTAVTVKTGDAAYSATAPKFTGTAGTVTVS